MSTRAAGTDRSFLDLQVAALLALCHSMGSRLAALAVGPQTLQQGTQPHKFVFAGADMRQQGFRQQLTAGGASNAHRVSVLRQGTEVFFIGSHSSPHAS